MGKYVKRQTPKGMPNHKLAASASNGLAKPFSVVGSRAPETRQNDEPRFEVHGTYRFSAGSLDDYAGKNLVVYCHGYNNDPNYALKSTASLFDLLQKSLAKDNYDLTECEFALFTWPGDTGPLYFNEAQRFAHLSGVALYAFLTDIAMKSAAKSVTLISHSLGAHVVLRCLSILGERYFHRHSKFRVNRALILAAAVEDDVFSNPSRSEEYHFPEAAFGVEQIHLGVSRADEVLGGAFRVNEHDTALGFNGPETMSTLASLGRRVLDVSKGEATFAFELHDFSPNSATIMNPALHVHSHSAYWANQQQTNYYVNLLR